MDSISDIIEMVFQVSSSSEMAGDCPFIPSDNSAKAVSSFLLLCFSSPGFLKFKLKNK
jgi:hypothetical protein